MKKILANRARCNSCNDIVESKHRWHIRTCYCGSLNIFGGRYHLERSSDQPWTEMSEFWEPVA